MVGGVGNMSVMIEVDEAKRLILDEARALDVVEVGLEEARGRVLAEEVFADRDFPPTDRSAMDGFAVRCEDIPERGAALGIAGEIRAGQAVGSIRVEAGQAVRITTGAIVPPIYETATYVLPEVGTNKGFDYTRSSNPTRQVLEANLAAIEGGKHAVMYASGMSAVDDLPDRATLTVIWDTECRQEILRQGMAELRGETKIEAATIRAFVLPTSISRQPSLRNGPISDS